MTNIMANIKKIKNTKNWAKYAWENWEPSCQPACDGCWKYSGYYLRSSYLTDYINRYLTSPMWKEKIHWWQNNEATNLDRSTFEKVHSKYCSGNFGLCECPHATFIKLAYGIPYNEESDGKYYKCGLNEIMKRFSKLRRIYIKKNKDKLKKEKDERIIEYRHMLCEFIIPTLTNIIVGYVL